MKVYFFIFVVFVGAGYYFTRDRDFTDLEKAVGTPHSKGKKTIRETKAEELRPNSYFAGECYKISTVNDWRVHKITKVDTANLNYHYVFCERFKGCEAKEEIEIISNFELDYPEGFKVKCPR